MQIHEFFPNEEMTMAKLISELITEQVQFAVSPQITHGQVVGWKVSHPDLCVETAVA